MSAQAEVGGPPGAPDPPLGPLRVRPPSPLSRGRRRIVQLVAVFALVGAAGLISQARSEDGSAVPGAAWRADPVPRSARVDDFERPGALGEVDGFGTWQTGTGSLVVGQGRLRSTTGDRVVATVDAGSSDVLVHAQVVRLAAGGGLVLSATPDGRDGLWLVAGNASDQWELRWERGERDPVVLKTFTASRQGVSVQVIRRGDRVKVAFDGKAFDVDVPPESAAGTWVGVASASPGNEIELFGYLRLDVG